MNEKAKGAPVCEVYSIKREEVIEFIQANHGQLRCVVEGWGAGKDFLDYCYFVSKNDSCSNADSK